MFIIAENRVIIVFIYVHHQETTRPSFLLFSDTTALFAWVVVGLPFKLSIGFNKFVVYYNYKKRWKKDNNHHHHDACPSLLCRRLSVCSRLSFPCVQCLKMMAMSWSSSCLGYFFSYIYVPRSQLKDFSPCYVYNYHDHPDRFKSWRETQSITVYLWGNATWMILPREQVEPTTRQTLPRREIILANNNQHNHFILSVAV